MTNPEKHPYDGTHIIQKKGCPNCSSGGEGLILMRSAHSVVSLYLCTHCHWTGPPFITQCETPPADDEPPKPPEEVKRTDLIAKAYRGQLSVAEVMQLVDGLMWRARYAYDKGKPCRTLVPEGRPCVREHADLELEITP